MQLNSHVLLLVVALVCFACATANLPARINLLGLGLLVLTLALIFV